MRPVHRLYLSPGMFGFGKLASFDYFSHVTWALARRFREHGAVLVTHVADVPPTASIRRRARCLAELIAATAGEEPEGSPIHLLGHSTGGLDARLVASPSARLALGPGKLDWLPRLRTVTTMSTPHYGTPLAGFFATVSGQRMLYALSALTVIGLSFGAPPLAAASALVMAIGNVDRALGVELRVLDRITDLLLGVLEPATDREVRSYLDAIRRDQGAVVQLTPEAMDLFLAGIEDRDGIYYQSVCAMAPPPTAVRLARSALKPWRALSSALFATMHGITSRYNESYPCASAEFDDNVEWRLSTALGRAPGFRSNDGVVPIRSQIWGHIAWAGYADHLDVLGHFAGSAVEDTSLLRSLFGVGRPSTPAPPTKADATTEGDQGVAKRSADDEGPTAIDGPHVDWLASGAGFRKESFEAMMDAVCAGMLGHSAGGPG